MKDFWNMTFLGNTTQAWITAIVMLLGGLLAIQVFKKIIIHQLKRLSGRTETSVDDFLVTTVEKSVVPLFYVAAFYFSLNALTFTAAIDRAVHVAFLFAFTFFLLGIITAVVRQFLFSFIHKQGNGETKEKQAKGLLIIINIMIWVLGIVFLIDNLGYDVTTLITGLGIGGIAIALAAQTILGDLFSYFIIFFDRPFEIGDFIIVDDKMGSVEYVGIKTTRLRTLGGEQLVCSNTYLTNARVHNYKRMEQRRVVFQLRVVYQTSAEQLRRVPELVKEIILSKENVRFDRAHFSGFGNSSFDFEFVYYVGSADYNYYMDRQQEIYLDIVTAFEAEKIKLAYPTQTLFVNQAAIPEAAPALEL